MAEQRISLLSFYEGWDIYKVLTRQWVSWYLIEHNVHHDGEIQSMLLALFISLLLYSEHLPLKRWTNRNY